MRSFRERFRSLDLKALFRGMPLTRVFGISWWAMLLLGLVLFTTDGLLFYRYGLGYAPLLEGADRSQMVRVEEDALKKAAAALNARAAEFVATSTLPADFPNPFR